MLNKMNLFFLLALLWSSIYLSNASDCGNFLTCGSCIGYASDTCIWCSADNHEGPRCKSKSESGNKSWCSVDIVDPQTNFTTKTDEDFNAGADGSKIVQFKPQLLSIRTRPGIPFKIEMTYNPAHNYPLDIYYLMDYSTTMKAHAETLQEQGIEIYTELSRLTNNVRLGVGSFVDKNALPLADPNTQISYSFKNHLPLTTDMNKFHAALASKPNGANYDEPEASLDGLMQAMVCTKEIGWRDNARRIIVLSTDSTYHSAGDGKFVGAFRPHDMKCHVTNNMYTKELELDYPSVHKISKVAQDNNFMIIFAADKKVQSHYKALEKIVKGSKYVPLEKKSKLVDIIKTEYLSLIRKIQLNYNIPPYMQFTLDQDCSKPGKCELQHNKSLEFSGSLVVQSCPPDQKYNQIVEIGPLMLNEKLKIEVEIDCECDCEKPGRGVEEADICENFGTYQCGVCKCYEKRRGSKCQCDESTSDKQGEDDCRYNNSTLLCSGRGVCSCGKCDSCTAGYSGPYCEFDNTACLGMSCSDHGVCKAGLCECSNEWGGKYCDCSLKKDTCVTSYSGKECSGNGKCECGACRCHTCSGQFCDDCEEVAMQNCKDLEDFAYCNLLKTKNECELEYNKTNTEVIIGNKTEVNSPDYYMAKYWCRKVLDNDQVFLFKYFYSTDKLHLIIQNELEMPPVANVWITVGSVIGAILLIGIITLIAWKILVDLHDKKEYDKFLKKATAAGYELQNPLYESPAINFSNPTYSG